MNKSTTFISLVLLLPGSLSSGCAGGNRNLSAPQRSTGASSQPVTVHVFEVHPSPSSAAGDLLIPAAISVPGTAVILAERGGRIMVLNGEEGTRIKKGDVLARFSDEDQRTLLHQTEIEVSRLKVEEQQYDALLNLSRSELDRENRLARDGVSSKAQVEQAQYKFEQAKHEYEKTRLATESGRARVRAAQIEIEKSVVRAPLDGVVTRRLTTLGTNVAQNDKLFEVSKLSPLEVKFQLPQSEGAGIQVGQIFNLSRINNDARIASARVRRIDPVADATTSTFGYLADIVGGSGLMPGLAVNVHLPRAGNTVSFWIPRTAFAAAANLTNGVTTTLFIVEGSVAAARTVLVTAVEGDQVEVSSGLAANDRVVLLPPPTLKDRDTVEMSPT